MRPKNPHIYNYRVTVRHDYGTVSLLVAARNKSDAKHRVLDFEDCPDRAITQIRRVNVQIRRASDE